MQGWCMVMVVAKNNKITYPYHIVSYHAWDMGMTKCVYIYIYKRLFFVMLHLEAFIVY